ncbi:hypothetical protein [Nostoc sp. CCY0012]
MQSTRSANAIARINLTGMRSPTSPHHQKCVGVARRRHRSWDIVAQSA